MPNYKADVERLEKSLDARCPGAFDAWVQDEQEKSARECYQEYLDEGSTDVPMHEWPASAMSFEEWCDHESQNKRSEPCIP